MSDFNIVSFLSSPGAPYILVLFSLILVGVGVGFWIHFGAGLACAGLLLGGFGILLGSD